MRHGTISVIIPTCNRPRFLEQGVESVLRQTRSATEILIVDDGSDDHVKPSLRGLACRHPAVAVHELPGRQGVSRARNLGLERAQGDYILFLDDDDLVPRTLLEAGASELDADPSLAGVIFSYKEVACEGFQGALRTDLFFDYRLEKETLLRNPFQVFVKSGPPVHGVMMRRSAIGADRFPEDLRTGEDWYFWVTLAFKGCRFGFRDDIQVSYRRHADTTTALDKHLFAGAALRCSRKLQQSGMLRSRHGRFVIAARSAFNLIRIRDARAISQGVGLLKYPVFTSRYLTRYGCWQLRSSIRQSAR
jgi:glycosyltransferase involved in cell wall biosynthesis